MANLAHWRPRSMLSSRMLISRDLVNNIINYEMPSTEDNAHWQERIPEELTLFVGLPRRLARS